MLERWSEPEMKRLSEKVGGSYRAVMVRVKAIASNLMTS